MHATKRGRMMMPSKAEILLLLGSVCQAAESRLLSSSNRSSQYTSYQGQNANASGDHPYLSIVLGIVLSAVLFTGFIFIVDRETFYEVIETKMKCSKCTRCSSARLCARGALTSCSKPDIDDDNDCGAPNISPQYITPETAEYFKNKHDEEFEKPKRVMLATQKWVLEKSSNYLGTVQNFLPNSPLPRALAKNVLPNKFDKNSDEDKYQIRDLEEIPTEEQTMEDKVAYQLWHGAEEIQEKIEDVRVRMFWKPTKDLDKVLDGKDKYNVEGEEKEIDIQCNSWFEEDANAPWS